MPDNLRAFLIILWSSVAGLVALAIAGSVLWGLHRGTLVFPVELQSQFVSTIILILAAAGPFVVGVLNRRQIDQKARETQEAVSRRADETQAEIVRTKVAVEEVVTTLHNGLRTDIAKQTEALVSEKARMVAADLASRQPDGDAALPEQVEANREAIAALVSHQAEVSTNTAAVVENTVSTDKNTEARDT